MVIILICVILGIILGVITAIIISERLISAVISFAIVGLIVGAVIMTVISFICWAIVPDSGYELQLSARHTIATNQDGALLYFNLTHDGETTYLYLIDENNEIQKVYINQCEVYFIKDGEQQYVTKSQYTYKNKILQSIAFVPLTRSRGVTEIYITESNWLKHTNGGLEYVITHPVQN